MSQDPPTRRTLADVVMEKIKDKQTELSTVLSGQWVHCVSQWGRCPLCVSVGKVLVVCLSGEGARCLSQWGRCPVVCLSGEGARCVSQWGSLLGLVGQEDLNL